MTGFCPGAALRTLEEVNKMTESEFMTTFATVFEDGEWILRQAYRARPFATVQELHDKMIAVINGASKEQKISFLGHHPEVRGAIATPDISEDSKNEAASVGLDKLTEDEFHELERLNSQYRTKFGFPFMLSLRRHTKDQIFSKFNKRVLSNDLDSELHTAISEITLITRIRLLNLVTGPGIPKTTGSLTTHVLDTVRGKPAAGVTIKLFEVSNTGLTLLATAVTNADGRTDAPLIANQPLRIGVYELQFHIGAYFRTTSREVIAEPAFVDVVPIRFGISEPEAHYHVPLLASPWSYSTYRGS